MDTTTSTEFERRKRDHIDLSLDAAHQALGCSGFSSIELVHEALPDLNGSDVALGTESLGGARKTPFYVSGMTGGHAHADSINASLATVCSQRGWALGLGSQRRELTDESFRQKQKEFRRRFETLEIFGNIGVAQLISASIEDLRRVVDALRPQALCVHANALQEMLQPEGTPHFRGWLKSLEQACSALNVPIVLKETGCGFSFETLRRLREVGVAAVDVSGLGGTHWGRIEGKRAEEASLQRKAAETFESWGVSTVNSVLHAREALPHVETWGSGGVRSGLDSAKLIALGCTRVGYAKPALESVMQSEVALDRWMELQEFELRIALFCTGCQSPKHLAQKERAWTRVTNRSKN